MMATAHGAHGAHLTPVKHHDTDADLFDALRRRTGCDVYGGAGQDDEGMYEVAFISLDKEGRRRAELWNRQVDPGLWLLSFRDEGINEEEHQLSFPVALWPLGVTCRECVAEDVALILRRAGVI